MPNSAPELARPPRSLAVGLNDHLHASDVCKEFIKRHESLRLKPYRDPVGKWTIGYGHLMDDDTPLVPISNAAAEFLFEADVREAERHVKRLIKVALTQYQFDALVSWTFNLGAGNLAASTMLRRLNARKTSAVPAEMKRWVYGGAEKLPGLIKRREQEAAMFEGVYA